MLWATFLHWQELSLVLYLSYRGIYAQIWVTYERYTSLVYWMLFLGRTQVTLQCTVVWWEKLADFFSSSIYVWKMQRIGPVLIYWYSIFFYSEYLTGCASENFTHFVMCRRIAVSLRLVSLLYHVNGRYVRIPVFWEVYTPLCKENNLLNITFTLAAR